MRQRFRDILESSCMYTESAADLEISKAVALAWGVAPGDVEDTLWKHICLVSRSQTVRVSDTRGLAMRDYNLLVPDGTVNNIISDIVKCRVIA